MVYVGPTHDDRHGCHGFYHGFGFSEYETRNDGRHGFVSGNLNRETMTTMTSVMVSSFWILGMRGLRRTDP